ncbi:MAG: hypothetical protein LQ344_000696 [Seirophora lacunosa]|nr:MAG: hypothetical protein LQ344_000696 [Seirophora lacunosa]
MAFWPFNRKKKDKTNEEKMASTRNRTTQNLIRAAPSEPKELTPPTLSKKPSRKESQKSRRNSSRKLTKRRDPEMTEPPLPTGPMLDRRDPLNEKILPGATLRSTQHLTRAPVDRGDVPSYYFQHQLSTGSLTPETFSAMPQLPTLSAKRSANDPVLPRRKSSKRKTDDHAREQEIKAMSSPIPIPRRPTSGASGFARQIRKDPDDGRRGDPTSDVSLPIDDSLASSVISAPESHSFRVSAFAVLSPRPTIRYSENPRFNSGSGSFGPSRTSTRKEKQPAIPEEPMNSRKRVDDLADQMNSGGLRELMERELRRTERLRQSDQEKLQRRLQRKADKQRAQVAAEERIAGLGLEESRPEPGQRAQAKEAEREQDAEVTESWLDDPERERGRRTPESWLKDPSREHLVQSDPFHDPVAGTGTSHLEAFTPTEEPEESILETAQAVRLSQASISPPTSPTQHAHEPSTLSHIAYLASRSTPDVPERPDVERRDSDTSARLSSNWRSMFRRSGTRANRSSTDRERPTPSEFSNTSRESFVRQMPPSAFSRLPQARSGTPPVRTQSRFKEDLPELPLSPPDSRVQSPEVFGQYPSPQLDQARASVTSNPSQPLSDIHPAFREEVALSRHQSLNRRSLEGPSTALMSQSLASVDSEGSWLTGRPVKRSSQNLVNPLRESAGSLQTRLRDLGASEDDVKSAEEENLQDRLTPAPEEVFARQRGMRGLQRGEASGITGESDDDDMALHSAPAPIAEEEGMWHGAVGRQPTIVRQGARARSREGLLNEFIAGEDSQESSPTADSPGDNASSPDTPFIQRATSVDFGKGHARHISAGSARLLNLPARSSGEMKRMSSGSGERSPLGPPSPRPVSERRMSNVE